MRLTAIFLAGALAIAFTSPAYANRSNKGGAVKGKDRAAAMKQENAAKKASQMEKRDAKKAAKGGG